MARVYVEAHGCAASYSDSEMISGILQSGGHTLTENPEESDAGVLVTCSVKDATADKMIYRIRSLSDKPLVVAGCMPKAEMDTVQKISGGATMMGPGSIQHTLEALQSALLGKGTVHMEEDDSSSFLPRVRLNPAVSIIQIARGCMSECSFCQTKLAKGDLTSYRPGDIVRQARQDISEGCCEVWLSSTDNGCYGLDIGTDLPSLVDAISSISGDFMVRVGMLNPMYMTRIRDGLLKSYRSEKVYKFLHIPVQSGSGDTLAIMRRGHTATTFQDTVDDFRQAYPDITISTDIIVGFPGESEEDFADTISLIRDSQPDIVNLSRYAARPGTAAAKMKQVPQDTIRHRSRILHEICRDISSESNAAWIGRTVWALFSEYTSKAIRGRTESYRPVHVSGDVPLGQWRRVTITNATDHGLVGRLEKN